MAVVSSQRVDVTISAPDAPALILAAPAGSVAVETHPPMPEGMHFVPYGSPPIEAQDWPDVLTAHRFEFRFPPQEFAREIDGLDI